MPKRPPATPPGRSARPTKRADGSRARRHIVPGPAKATPVELRTGAITSGPTAPCAEHRDATTHVPLDTGRSESSAFPPMQSNAALSRCRPRKPVWRRSVPGSRLERTVGLHMRRGRAWNVRLRRWHAIDCRLPGLDRSYRRALCGRGSSGTARTSCALSGLRRGINDHNTRRALPDHRGRQVIGRDSTVRAGKQSETERSDELHLVSPNAHRCAAQLLFGGKIKHGAVVAQSRGRCL